MLELLPENAVQVSDALNWQNCLSKMCMLMILFYAFKIFADFYVNISAATLVKHLSMKSAIFLTRSSLPVQLLCLSL